MPDRQSIKEIVKENIKSYGKNVYLLGTSEFGKTNEPVLVNSLSDFVSTFGKKGSLFEVYKEINTVFNDINIFCCKVSGTHAEAKLNVNIFGKDIIENGITFKSVYSNEIYDKVNITLLETSLLFSFPAELGGGSKEYFYSDFRTIGELAKKINEDTLDNLNCINVTYSVDESTELIGALNVVNSSNVFLLGGDSGVDNNKDELFLSLAATLAVLEGERVDVVVPVDMYMDDIYMNKDFFGEGFYGEAVYSNFEDSLSYSSNFKSYYNLILEYCANQINFGKITIGVMGFKKVYDDPYIIKKIIESNQKNTKLKNFFPLISVTIGELIVNHSVINSSYIYSCLIANTDFSKTIINTKFSSRILINNQFDNSFLESMNDIGVVCFRVSPLKRCVVVSNSPTTGDHNSELFYIHNVRQVQIVLESIYDLYVFFVGEDINSLVKDRKLEKDVEEILDILKNENIIKDSQVVVSVKNKDELFIDINLKSTYMIQYIKSLAKFSIKKGDSFE